MHTILMQSVLLRSSGGAGLSILFSCKVLAEVSPLHESLQLVNALFLHLLVRGF